MSAHIRRAGPLDSGEMARLLNEIIEQGGTTAITKPVTGADLADKMAQGGAWHIAENDQGTMLGFQWIGPNADLPPEACDIATFVQIGLVKQGIGSRLFAATARAARDLGYRWINATIRADNEGGLTYYRSRGFEDWKFSENVQLDDGSFADKVSKRFDLK